MIPDEDERAGGQDRRLLAALVPSPRGRPTESCNVCGELTSDRKPYCARHIERMPYVQTLLEKIAAGMDVDEDGRPADASHLKPKPITEARARAALERLFAKTYLTAELAEAISIKVGAAGALSKTMESAGLVTRIREGCEIRMRITDLGRRRLRATSPSEPHVFDEPKKRRKRR